MGKILRISLNSAIFVVLTILTQIGGVVWLVSRFLPKYKLLGFVALYTLTSIALTFLAPIWGRERLPIMSTRLAPQSFIYVAMNRNFVTPDMHDVAYDLAYKEAEISKPPYALEYLDGGFPFGFIPLLPHLSHKDGRKLDFALPYEDGNSRSPIGYFAFEYPEKETCPEVFPTLRWNFHWLQPLWRDAELDEARLKTQLEILTQDPRVEKIFLEPHLVAKLGLNHEKIRFQGCRAARRDDHIHVQVK